MSKPLEFMEKYKIDSDEVWEVRRGGAWAVKHAALERVATEQGITFDRPAMIEHDAKNKIVAICVFGTLKDRTEWSIGEASPDNNKNAYCYAMAEKRGKDRVILKLLNAHGRVYSESEIDEQEPRSNGDHKSNGGPFSGEPKRLAKKDAREIYAKLQAEHRLAETVSELQIWMHSNLERIKVLPEDWEDTLRLQCQEHLLDLKQREAA